MGAAKALLQEGRFGLRCLNYGSVSCVFVWEDNLDPGYAFRLKPGSSQEVEMAVVPLHRLEQLELAKGCSASDIEAYFLNSSPSDRLHKSEIQEEIGASSPSNTVTGELSSTRIHPDKLIDGITDLMPMTITYKREPERSFKLEIYHHNCPNQLIPFIGTIKKGCEWEALGVNPYSVRRTSSDGEMESLSSGSVQVEGCHYDFYGFFAGQDKKWGEALRTGKRHVSTASDVHILRKLGIAYEDICNLSPHFHEYSEAMLAVDRGDYEAAIEHAQTAIELHPKEMKYREMLLDARMKNGDIGVIHEGLNLYKNDMSSGADKAERWIRLAIVADNNYQLVLDIAITVIDRLDAEIAGKIDRRIKIYSSGSASESKRFCSLAREKLIKRLGSMREFLCEELIVQNMGRVDFLKALLDKIIRVNPSKIKKISKLLALIDDPNA